MSQIPEQAPKALLLGAIFKVLTTWTTAVNEKAPQPYLDEVFHIPQAQKYWAGEYFEWDPKITTPPGLYLFSNFVSAVRKVFVQDLDQNTEELRYANALLFWLLLFTLRLLNRVKTKRPDKHDVLYREVNIVMFPLLFFFSGLYYTDLFSAWTVVVTYIFWSLSVDPMQRHHWAWKAMQFVAGVASLCSRQTNVFWVAVFLGGLQVVETLKQARVSFHDPAANMASFEDYVKFVHSVALGSLRCIPGLVIDLLPQLTILGCFAAFILWNGGVVLGDKENHVASLHLPQMLYIWPLMLFFSWPVLLPQIRNWRMLLIRLPRPITATAIMALMGAAVHFNTIVHPFTLADNRHYMFYVFRLLMRHPAIKYLVVPAYFACAWLVLGAFAGARSPESGKDTMEPVRISYLLIWLVSTALSLITAPLVEPRYFIVPWLLWRLHLPYEAQVADSKVSKSTPKIRPRTGEEKYGSVSMLSASTLLQLMGRNHLWIELAWYLLINYATCWVFLQRGFKWKQEPHKVQRFMW